LKITQAVLDANVKRYIPWQFGIDYDVIGRGSGKPLFDEQLDVRDLLRNQKLTDWVVLSTGMFMSFLFEKAFGVVDLEKNVVRALGSWNTKVSVTAVEDIGMVVAELVGVWGDRGVENGVVYCAGDTISYGDLAETVERVLEKQVAREELAVEVLDERLRREPGNGIVEYQLVFGAGKGTSWEMEETFNYKNGMILMNVEEWALKNLKTREVV